ncbi:MAG: FtsW/RodA/SpoVE family cell cycle protein [Anaerolineae bacterium]
MLAGVFLALTYLNLILVRNLPITDLWYFGLWALTASIGHWALNQYLPRRDSFLYPVLMLLTGWGIVTILRVAPIFAGKQTGWLLLSSFAMFWMIASTKTLRWLSDYRYTWLIGGLLLLLATILFGQNPSGGGPRLWLGISDFYFQPSELLKLLLVAFFASYLSNHSALLDLSDGGARRMALRFFGPLLLMWGVCMVVLLWQRDLGTAALFFIVFIAMIYLASGRASYVLGGALLLVAAGVVAYFAIDLVRLRINIWLNPWSDTQGQSFQVVQSLMAFAAGGVFGQGIGQGSPTYVPVVHSDFIFAAIGEEWGLIGSLAVVMSFALLVMRAFRLAAAMQGRMFRVYLAAGIGITFAAQSLMIMGGVLKIIPLTGVTLPFLSYGGSSLLISFVMVGLLLFLSNERQ